MLLTEFLSTGSSRKMWQNITESDRWLSAGSLQVWRKNQSCCQSLSASVTTKKQKEKLSNVTFSLSLTKTILLTQLSQWDRTWKWRGIATSKRVLFFQWWKTNLVWDSRRFKISAFTKILLAILFFASSMQLSYLSFWWPGQDWSTLTKLGSEWKTLQGENGKHQERETQLQRS